MGRRIARTSSTPGKTQFLNVFRLPALYLLDLPGYGYARASHGERRRFRQLVDGVLQHRPRLAGVVWLIDIRHPPSKDDLVMRDVLIASDCSVQVTLTKADKLARAKATAEAARRTAELGIDPDTPPILTSATRGTGIGPLADAIMSLASAAGSHPESA